MTEFVQCNVCMNLRYGLLLSVSSAAVLLLASETRAQDSHPTVWIELGGAFDRVSNDSVGWLPPNLPAPISNPLPEPFGKLPGTGYDFDAAVELQPNGSDWIFDASVRYGRAQRPSRRFHDQTYETKNTAYNHNLTTYAFVNAKEKAQSSHAIVDFNVGRDVGLGLSGGRSTIHFGVRMAQLSERADASLTAVTTAPIKYSPGKILHKADALMVRSYAGVGPAVSWDGTTPFVGSLNDGLSFDWGANASVLFGRQKAQVVLHTQDARYLGGGANTVLSQMTSSPLRQRTVAVPNLGGFAGVSWRIPNVKVSFGYRGDFFFNAVDGGISTDQKETRGFYGPFATVSIGLGG